MDLRSAFGTELKRIRLKKKLSQEAFALVSSRTNISLLERGGTTPTLKKVDDICSVLGVHPVSLIAACYLRDDNQRNIHEFIKHVEAELQYILQK